MLRNRRSLLLGVLCLALAPLASPAQSCPVTVEKINPRATFGAGAEDPWGLFLYVRYANSSTKQIEAVRFSVVFSDIISNGKRSVWDYVDDRRVKPGSRKDAIWGDGVYIHELGRSAKATVHLLRVAFSDGSKWEEAPSDAESRCTWVSQ